jgi:iron complex outermembrane receptor protein
MKRSSPGFVPSAIGVALALGLVGSVASSVVIAADSDQLEEVVVTAEKREVNLQKVSVSIQVKQGEELRQEGKQRIDEIMQGTVGIQAQDNRTGLTFFVRGVDSSTGNPGQSIVSPVAVIVDGVAQSRSEVVRGGTLDLARAEIMRGPQSTTLGANAAAGAVSLVSNQPVLGTYQARGQVEIGNYSKRQIEGVFNAPLGNTSALRVAFSQEKRDGYISAGAGDSDITSVRAKLRWQPTDNLDTVLTASTQHIGGNGVQQNVLLAYGQWHATTPADYASLPLTSSGCGSTDPTILVMGCPATYWARVGAATPVGQSFRERNNAWDDGFPSGALPNSPFRDSSIHTLSLQADWKTAIGTLTVLPSVQYAHFRGRESPRGGSYMTEENRQVTPTLDAYLSSNSNERLEWKIGAYYSRDKAYNWWTGFIDYPSMLPSGVGGPPSNCFPPGVIVSRECFAWQDQPLTLRTNVSAYADGKFSILDSLRLVGGLRYAHDTARQQTGATVLGDASGADLAANAAAGYRSGSATWSKTTYRVGVEYDVLPRTMLYANYSSGYTPGRLGVSAPGPTPPGLNPVFVSEETTLEQLSAGWKSQFFDNRVQLNGDFFRTTFYNRQVQGTINYYIGDANSSNCFGPFPPPPGALSIGATGTGGYCLTVNQDQGVVPQFVSMGLDLDGVWLITPNDRLSFTYEYLKAKYDTVPQAPGGDLTPGGVLALAAGSGFTLTSDQAAALSTGMLNTLQGFVGSQLQNAPQHSFTVDYQHEFMLPGGSRLSPRVSGVYKTKYWSFGGAPGANISQILADQSSANLAWQQSYTKWDLFLNWQTADGKIGVNAYVKNVGNEVVLANYTYPYVSLEAPRTVGLIVSAQL